ncbi:MAG TPA: GNAT family N-acetyltransferase [Vicinamibacterales bacterium]|jgi:aminoglycoside 6'-N-acetyltransferase I
MVVVRQARLGDRTALADARADLWPKSTREQHEAELSEMLSAKAASASDILVAESGREIVGFVEVSLRSHADGCDPHQPVVYIEGWYVKPEFRRHGVGRTLIAAAENWGRARGCVEMASDTWIDHDVSQRAHEAIGFTVVDRCVHYKKML